MATKFIIEYEEGPASRVGPFPDRETANAWAEKYVVEYNSLNGDLSLSWNLAPVVDPSSLEWW